MATTERFVGQNLKLFIDLDGDGTASTYAEVGCSTTVTMSFERSMIDARCKDDGNYDNAIPSTISGTCDLEGFVIYTNDINVEEFWNLLNSGAKANLKLTTNVSGDPEIISAAYLTSFSQTGAVDEVVTYSVSFRLVEEPTFSTVS